MALAVDKFSVENHIPPSLSELSSDAAAKNLLNQKPVVPAADLTQIHEKKEPANDATFEEAVIHNSEQHENQIFKALSEILKNPIKILNTGNRPVLISAVGAGLHFLDSFIEGSKLPASIKKLSLNSSIWYSKLVTVLPNALKGVELLAKNDFVDGISRIYSLVGKLFQPKPANFSISSGLFPGVQMGKFVIGEEKYNAQNFKSFGENINFFVTGLKESIASSLIKIRSGENIWENIFKAVVPVGLISSSLIGTAVIGDEVSTPKARAIGFVRNFSGAGGDLLLLMKAYKDAVLKHGRDKALGEVFKSNDLKVGLPYILASVGELLNRYTKDPFQSRFAQLLCGANETISAYWGAISGKKNDILESELLKA